MLDLDEFDKKIIKYLQEDASISNIELSKKIPSATYIIELVENNIRRPKKSKAY